MTPNDRATGGRFSALLPLFGTGLAVVALFFVVFASAGMMMKMVM